MAALKWLPRLINVAFLPRRQLFETITMIVFTSSNSIILKKTFLSIIVLIGSYLVCSMQHASYFLQKNILMDLFLFIFHPTQFKYKLIKVQMVCLGLEPRAAEWKAQTNPLSYSGTPILQISLLLVFLILRKY